MIWAACAQIRHCLWTTCLQLVSWDWYLHYWVAHRPEGSQQPGQPCYLAARLPSQAASSLELISPVEEIPLRVKHAIACCSMPTLPCNFFKGLLILNCLSCWHRHISNCERASNIFNYEQLIDIQMIWIHLNSLYSFELCLGVWSGLALHDFGVCDSGCGCNPRGNPSLRHHLLAA